MSYDISLYKPEFLRRAIEQRLGDWTDADPIPMPAIEGAVTWLIARGYTKEFEHPQLGRDFAHPNQAWGVQVGVHRGSISFSIPYWDGAVEAITAAKADAEELAEFTGLAVHDPQTGDGE